MDWRGLWKIAVCFVILTLIAPHVTWAQSVASGTVEGVVTDPTGAVLSNATVVIRNALTGYQQQTTTDDSGTFRFSNLPFNNYRLEVTFVGFSPSQQDINVRTSVPINMKVMLSVSGLSQAVTVEATGEILEQVPFAHSTIDISTLDKLPTFSPAS